MLILFDLNSVCRDIFRTLSIIKSVQSTTIIFIMSNILAIYTIPTPRSKRESKISKTMIASFWLVLMKELKRRQLMIDNSKRDAKLPRALSCGCQDCSQLRKTTQNPFNIPHYVFENPWVVVNTEHIVWLKIRQTAYLTGNKMSGFI